MTDPNQDAAGDTRKLGGGHAMPRMERLDAVRRLAAADHAPLYVLTAVVVVWVVVMGRLILLRDHNLAAFDFDSGINDQYIWQLAHFRQANTVRGLTFLGNHAYYALVLFIPLVWLGRGLGTWDVLHTVALGSVAFPLYCLAKDKLGRPWVGCAVGVVWLAQPSVQWFVQEGFHPENFALPFLVGTYLYGERFIVEHQAGSVSRHTKWGLVACFVLTIAWKEDLALALVGMGLGWLVRRHWRLALRVTGVAGLYFVVVGMILIPRFAGGSVFAGAYNLGNTPTAIAKNVAEHPSRLTHQLARNDAVGYAGGLNQSYGFVTLLSPATLLIGLPQATIDIISASNFTWNLRFHYQSIPMGALVISMVEGLGLLHRRRRWLGQAGVVLALGAALLCSHWYGPSPIGLKYNQGYWPLQPGPTVPIRREIIKAIPSSQGVSADYLLVPQLTHRQYIYTFPNPWINQNYGIKPTDLGDPAKVQWVTVELDLLGPQDSALLASIEASGEFKPVIREDGVVLLERIHPPGHGKAPIVIPPPSPP